QGEVGLRMAVNDGLGLTDVVRDSTQVACGLQRAVVTDIRRSTVDDPHTALFNGGDVQAEVRGAAGVGAAGGRVTEGHCGRRSITAAGVGNGDAGHDTVGNRGDAGGGSAAGGRGTEGHCGRRNVAAAAVVDRDAADATGEIAGR